MRHDRGMSWTPAARRATPADAAALLELRVAMLSHFFDEVPGGEWRELCRAMLEQRLAETSGDFAAFVVDGPAGVPVSSGVGWIQQHLPSPRNPHGRRGHIASMSTLPEHRGQGCGRAVVTALLDWMASEGVTRVELRASTMGEPLYRSLGFKETAEPTLVWTAPRRP
jgi:GNAT superfamily N-acetyltransferase